MADDDYGYLAGLSAHPGRPGDTANFNPAFASALAKSVRQARAAGLPVTLNSGFREPGQTGSAYDAGGNSSHTYGLASDVGGLDGPNGKITNAWAQIAEANGLHNPYGVGDAKEFNHWQLPAQPLENTPQLLASLKAAKATGSFQNVWNAYGTGAGGYAGGAAPIARPASAAASGFMDSLANIESGNRNIFSSVDKDYPGQPGSRSQGYFQIDTPTWQQFGAKVGIDTKQYKNAMSAPRDVQAQVAAAIPFGRFGQRTQNLMAQQFGPLNTGTTIGELAGSTTPAAPTPAAATPGTTINTTGAGAGALPGFGTKAASDQFLGGLKQMGITPPTDQPDQDAPKAPPLNLFFNARNYPGPAGVEAAARQRTPNIAQQLYGQTLNSQPLAWSNQAIPAPSWMTNAGAQGAPQGMGTSLNSLSSQQMAYGLSPYQLQMMMNPMMLDQGGGYG